MATQGLRADPLHKNWTKKDSAKREADDMTRRMISMDIIEMPHHINVLSFPAARWVWEQTMRDKFDFKQFVFTGIERDKRVYNLAKKHRPRNGSCLLHPEPASVQEFLATAPPKQSFNIVYLDWMGFWSEEKKEDLRMLFSNRDRLAVGGVLILTLSLVRGTRDTNRELKKLAKNNLSFFKYDERGLDRHTEEIRVNGIPKWVVMEGAENRVWLQPLSATVYYSPVGKEGGGMISPQVQFVFKRLS